MYEIDIKNYQIISHIHLQLKPGLTILSGPSNNGKSSIIKAIKQAIYNTSGTNFIKQGETSCTINITTPDNHSFTYHKSSTSSRSYVQIDNNDKITKLGTSQLPEVKDLFHIDSSLNYNFWDQLTKPFLIGLSHSQQFNSLNTSTLTAHLANIHQTIHADSQYQHDNSTRLQGQLDQLQLTLKSITNSLQVLDASILPRLISITPNITSAYNLITDYLNQFNSLKDLYTTLHSYTIPSPLQLPNTDFTSLQSNINSYDEVNKLLSTINSTNQAIDDLKLNLDNYTKLLSHFNTCPLCHKPLDNHNH